jgi:hypothetical protein
MRRIGRTPVTCPNVGELTTVSMVANCRVLKMLPAWI